MDQEKWVPLGTPRGSAEIIQFKPKDQKARIRYLRSIISDHRQPFDRRMDALVQVAMINRKRA